VDMGEMPQMMQNCPMSGLRNSRRAAARGSSSNANVVGGESLLWAAVEYGATVRQAAALPFGGLVSEMIKG
jgi:hypothetical protein